MSDLDELYRQLIQRGLIVLREAIYSSDKEWMIAEVEMLHNIPSLIGETKIGRHEYYWDKERTQYIKWVENAINDIAATRMRQLYEPVWKEMEPLILRANGAE